MVAGSNPAWGARAQASYLRTTVPPGPTALRDAKKALTKLLNQVDEKRAPRTSASVNQLLDRYFEIRTDLAGGTLRDYMSKACRACTRMCKPYQCQPLKDSGIRAI